MPYNPREVPRAMPGRPDLLQQLCSKPASSKWPILSRLFAFGDLASKAEQAEIVVFWKGSGKTLALFDNPHYKKRLLAMGLRPDTAVGCALNFLFEPNAAVKAVFEREFASLSQPQVLRIGIQIRTSSYSDAAFFDKEKAAEELHLSFWDAWFDCAQQIEDEPTDKCCGTC